MFDNSTVQNPSLRNGPKGCDYIFKHGARNMWWIRRINTKNSDKISAKSIEVIELLSTLVLVHLSLLLK